MALRHIAQRYDIPVEQLVIVNEHRREYTELGRAFRAFTLLDTGSKRFFNLMVDLKDQAIVEDVEAIEQAEANARQAKYGKLAPALHARLQKAADDELVEVAIWIAGRPRRGQAELFAELATRFPEARLALEQSGKPFDVLDLEARTRIEQAYIAMSEADVQPLVGPKAIYKLKATLS